jgi:hypothetical protein
VAILLHTDALLFWSSGADLNYVVKTQKTLPERDGRALVMQILSCLK